MGEFCGIFSIINILRSHRALRYDRGELAYWCSPEHQLKGIMTEAGRSVVEFAFTKLGLNRLVVGHHLNNSPSQKLIERLGFTPIGIEHQAFIKDGHWIDIRTYELLARDYSPVA
jgi:RimJ/RimL family protein N-acetyltransferase